MTYQIEWRKEDEARIERLEQLYFLDGRDKRDHPDHMTYTGLAMKYREQQASE